MTLSDFQNDNIVALVRAFQNGDEIAFAALYQHYKKGIFRFCCKFLNYAAAAEDVTQETFLAAFEHRAEVRQPENFRAYLFTIARRRCLNHLRKHAREKEIDEALIDDAAIDERYEQAAEIEQIQRAISELSPDYREVILLREYEDLSYVEIAEVLSCSEAAVKARLFKARRKLYDKLKAIYISNE
jgi:RNA polymerase sigma-70 factor (ECF subfamily)